MDKWLKKRAALYQLIKSVDENKGSITIKTDKVKRVFNDSNDIVRIEYVNGEIALFCYYHHYNALGDACWGIITSTFHPLERAKEIISFILSIDH